jgi:4-hydroxy-3-methylbut-2-en-1-yl diphosphate synthase IspG/GcpE
MSDDHETIDQLTNDFSDAAHDLGYGIAMVLIDGDGDVKVGLSTQNVSEATVCVGVLLTTILREGEPACPHCLNNFRRCEAALRTMREHRTVGEHDHSLH